MYCDENRMEFGEGTKGVEVERVDDMDKRKLCNGSGMEIERYPSDAGDEYANLGIDLDARNNHSINADKFNEYLGDEANVDDLKIDFENDTVTILFTQNTERVTATIRISADITKVVNIGVNGEEMDLMRPRKERS